MIPYHYKKILAAGTLMAAALFPVSSVKAQEPAANPDQELRQEIENLKKRLDELQAGTGAQHSRADDEKLPAAAPGGPFREFTERILGGTSIGSYGEVIYRAPSDVGPAFASFNGFDNANNADAYRFILFLGHDFNDWVRFFAEVEIEHGGKEVEMEQAFVDLRPHQAFGIQAGVLLVPVSHINKYHEPTTYWSAQRPLLDRWVRPTTWWEPGIAIYGQPNDYFSYELMVVDGLRVDKLRGRDGIRNGRQKGIEAFADDLAFAGRLEVYPTEGLSIGVFGYHGGADQNLFEDCKVADQAKAAGTNPCSISGLKDVRVSMFTSDIVARIDKAELRFGHGLGFISRAGAVNAALSRIRNEDGDTNTFLPGAPGTVAPRNVVASRFWGWNVEGSYDVLAAVAPRLEQSGRVFVRYEDVDMQSKVPAGYLKDPARLRRQVVAGVAYLPHPGVVLKADYEWMFSNTNDDPQQFNLAVGWNF